MQTKHKLFALMTVALLGAATSASAQGPGASGAAATIPERDVRPSITGTAPSNGMSTTPSPTIGESRERAPMSREGTTTTGPAVGTTNPENSTSR
jgi:hypothetical protein